MKCPNCGSNKAWTNIPRSPFYTDISCPDCGYDSVLGEDGELVSCSNADDMTEEELARFIDEFFVTP